MNVHEMNVRGFPRLFSRLLRESMGSIKRNGQIFYSTAHFHHMLRMERKRAERSQKHFFLTLLDLSRLHTGQGNGCMREKIQSALVSCSRDTDVLGWYEHDRIMGVIYTEVASAEESTMESIFAKLHKEISKTIATGWIKISFQTLPERNGDSAIDYEIFNITLDPVHPRLNITRQIVFSAKTLLVMAGRLFAFFRFSLGFSWTSRQQKN